MKKSRASSLARTPGLVLGKRAFSAISAVEGLSLKPASRSRLRDMDARGLSADEKRAEIIRAYKK